MWLRLRDLGLGFTLSVSCHSQDYGSLLGELFVHFGSQGFSKWVHQVVPVSQIAVTTTPGSPEKALGPELPV